MERQTLPASEPTALPVSPPGPDPLPERAENVLPIGSGSGWILPDLEGIAWEKNSRGGFEAWLAPRGPATPRREKTYLGYLGVRKLRTLDQDSIRGWVETKRSEKQI